MRRKGSAGCDREGEERGGGGKADRPEKRKKKAVGLGGCGVVRQFRFVVSLVNPVPLPVVACPAEIGLFGGCCKGAGGTEK